MVQTIPFQFVPKLASQLSLWTGTLKYTVNVSFPPGDANPAFVALKQDDREVMLQTVESAASDMEGVMPFVGTPGMALYHKVDSLQGFDAEAEDVKVLLGPRKTLYGATEIWVQDQSGYVHAFAEKKGT